jgi:hypothetical protein
VRRCDKHDAEHDRANQTGDKDAALPATPQDNIATRLLRIDDLSALWHDQPTASCGAGSGLRHQIDLPRKAPKEHERAGSIGAIQGYRE